MITAKTKAEAYNIRYEWEKVGVSPYDSISVLVEDTGEFVTVHGPRLCVWCGKVFIPSEEEPHTCGWCNGA